MKCACEGGWSPSLIRQESRRKKRMSTARYPLPMPIQSQSNQPASRALAPYNLKKSAHGIRGVTEGQHAKMTCAEDE